MKSTKTAFVGRWRITEMEQWDQEYIDMDGPGHITFTRDNLGEFHFGCVNTQIDWRHDPEAGRVDFTFEGFDEGDEVSGRGWARIEGKELVGFFAFHLGDESGFKASKSR